MTGQHPVETLQDISQMWLTYGDSVDTLREIATRKAKNCSPRKILNSW